jgi:serine/threonine protein kinase
MSPDHWQTVNEIFHAAIACSGDARRALLDEACARKPRLLEDVERLLNAHAAAAGFMSVPAAAQARLAIVEAEPSAVGAMVGPYRIIREIGRGGMGTVYLAERADDQFHRQVAVKLIKRGMDTDAVLRRFHDERQILADLEHPNIARLIDGGTTDDGRPYFLMEYVDGQPIDRDCDERRLTIEQRLGIFLEVCAAVSHAHQRLVVHRDIKPSNILVTADGAPKLLDFGIAKVIQPSSADEALATAAVFRPMTPEYASLEQLQGLASTTLGDVYSLGVLLHELLVGCPPFRFTTRTPHDIARVLTTVDPSKPSDVVARRGGAGGQDEAPAPEDVSAARATTSAHLRSRLRGDLDTIVLTALRRDRERRYQSVDQLADDIRRHLNALPIAARQDAVLYRTVKFVRRNAVAVGAATVVFTTLVAGIAATTWEAIRAGKAEQAALLQRDRATTAELAANTERDRAVRAQQLTTSERLRAEQERNRALEESKRADAQSAAARAISDFLQNDLLAQASSLTQSGPTITANPNLTVRSALDRAAERIAGKFDADPAIEAAVRQTIGMTYRDLALYPEAEQQLERAVALRRRLLGATHPDTMSSMQELGLVYIRRGKTGPAEALLTSVLAGQRRLLGDDHADTLATMSSLANVMSAQGRYAESETLFLKILQSKRRALGAEHPDTLTLMHDLVSEYANQGKYAQAAELGRQVVASKRRVFGEEHPSTLQSMNALGVVYRNQGKYAEAEVLLAKTLDARRRVVGADHPDTLASLTSLALVYQAEEQYARSESLLLQGLEARRRVLGAEHPPTVGIMNNLAELYRREGKQHEAETLFTQVLELRRRALGPDHPITANVLTALSTIKLDQNQYAEAETLLREAVNAYEKKAPDSWRRFYAQSLLGVTLARRGKNAEAETLLRSGYQRMMQLESSIPAENRSVLDEVKNWINQLYED